MKKFSSLYLALILFISSLFGCNVSATLEGTSFACLNESEVDELLDSLNEPEFVNLFTGLDRSAIEEWTNTIIRIPNFFDIQNDLIIFLLKCVDRPDLVSLMKGEQVWFGCNKRESSDCLEHVTEACDGIFCTGPRIFYSSKPITVALLAVIEAYPYKYAFDYLEEMGL